MTQIAKFAGSIACLVAGASFLASAAFARQDAEQNALEIEYGTSLICHTTQEAAQLVAHLDSGLHAALSEDADADDEPVPPPCQAVTIAFVRGQTLDTLRTKDATFQMVRVLVVGMGAPNEYRSVAPQAFISLIKVMEYEV
jgi:hypothetical protein